MEEDRAVVNLGPEISSEENGHSPTTQPKQPRKRFIGRRAAAERAAATSTQNGDGKHTAEIQTSKPPRTPRTLNQIPPEILHDEDLNAAIAHLPSNYNFEIHKTIHRIRSSGAKNIALQFPEGLLLFAPLISDILTRFCPGTETLIMGDVTYGACCIDDYTARALGCDLLVHYGHSCLVPIDTTQGIKTLYVFVTIGIDTEHLLATIERNFAPGKTIALVGTIQFNATIHAIVPRLRDMGYTPLLPRAAPLSAGEILGCTAPPLSTSSADLVLYVGDGRFHIESVLISSPGLRDRVYRYDPYARRLTHETYAHEEMHSLRGAAVRAARRTLDDASAGRPRAWGLVLGTLGRQGNPSTLELIRAHLARRGVPALTLLLSELSPQKLALMSADVAVWVQVACPRLSIDWGYAFERPLLSPYEALVALGVRDGAGWEGASGEERDNVGVYPMDYYEKSGLGRTKAEDVPEVPVGGMEVEVT